MTQIFGEVASMYDDVRPAYPDQVLDAIIEYHGGVPASVVDLGAGTGKGTELLVRLPAPVTCVEPDPRMAAVLTAKFPQVHVENSTFEQWTPPPAGMDVVACAMAWHWLAPETRNQLARAALAPGGTLAVFGHLYDFADPAVGAAILKVMHAIDPTVAPRPEHWILDDITASGVFPDVREQSWHTFAEFSTARYLQLMQTFSPFRRKTPEDQQRSLTGIGAAIDAHGGSLVLDLHTTLVLASG